MAGNTFEILQEPAYRSLHEEALLSLLRTADTLGRAVQRKTRCWGVTSTQYNVLRILKAAHPRGLPCAAIGQSMITAEPDITRLLARLSALKLVHQRRDPSDRRVVRTEISTAGLQLLEAMDATMAGLPGKLLAHMEKGELAQLIRLLELARARQDNENGPITCDGTKGEAQLR